MKVHYKQIDLLKGLAIGMVILGHSIIVHPINLNMQYSWCNYLHWFVSSAHMSLFFAISGFCFSFDGWKTYLSKKFKRIVLPFIVFSIFGLLVNLILGTFINEPKSFIEGIKGILIGSSIWFLYTLTLIFLIFPFIMNGFNNCIMSLILIIFLGSLQLFRSWPSFFCIDRMIKYIFYFSIGFCLKLESKKDSRFWKGFIKLVKQPLVWMISLIIWVPLVYLLVLFETGNYQFFALLSIITALVGMVNIISFGFLISKNRVSNIFEETGKVSLQLFLFNGYFLTVTRTLTVQVLHISSPVIIIAANVIMMYFVSYAFIHFVIKRVKLFRVLTGMV